MQAALHVPSPFCFCRAFAVFFDIIDSADLFSFCCACLRMTIAHRIGRTTLEDTDDDEPLFTAKDPLSTSPVHTAPSRKRVRREKCVPPSVLDKVTEKIRQGGKEVSLIGAPIEPDMDFKLAVLIEEVMRRPHVVSVELQASMISTFK